MELEQSHDEHQHKKNSHCDNCQLLPCIHVLDYAMHQLHQLFIDFKASNYCSWFKMKIATVVPPWPDLNLHCISSISMFCLICLSNMHPNTLINCLINLKPLLRAPPLPLFILSILLCTNSRDYVSNNELGQAP